MAGHVSAAMLADAQLLVSELVANSVRHADAPVDAVVRVSARVRDDVVHLEVGDRGTSGSIARRAPDLKHGSGFGLNIVEKLSRRWGVDRDDGTRVWADVAFGQPAETHRNANERGAARQNSARVARTRAVDARRRAVAARQAAEQATTGYARRAHHRAAELHSQLAVSHEDFARTLRRGGSDFARE
jgi:anti-sigma regulatory factor (Ser/Thr protein kinase)